MTTREQWLERGLRLIYERVFKAAGVTWDIDTVRVSCSWPGGGSSFKRIGECWPRGMSSGGFSEIFISPKISHGIDALDILTHEMVHSSDDCKSGHKGHFVRVCKLIGLTKGKPKSASAGEELLVILKGIVEDLGVELDTIYPHARLDLSARKKKATYLIKCTCLDDGCGATWRMTQSWIDRASLDGLKCPVCGGDAEHEPAGE